MTTMLKNTLALFASAIALLGAPALRAQVLTFNVDLNTATLSADSANAPFDLDFQLNYGNSALASNTVTLSAFTFTGGSALGSAVTSGSATGSLASSVALTANSTHPFSELFQQFSSGTTDIKFTATVNEPGPNVGVPTQFSAAILDQSLGFPAQLFTTAPDTASLVTLDLSASNTIANVGAYTSTSSADGNTAVPGVMASITAIPEPSTTAAIFGGVVMMFAFVTRRFGRTQTA